MKNMSTKMLVEAGIMIALAQILSYIKIEMPNGGSITLGSMIPIMIFAIRWGLGPGLIAGTVYGILQFILGPKYVITPFAVFLDYIAAFGLLGLAGFFKRNIFGIISGVIFAIFSRFMCHVLSGVIFYSSYAPEGMNPWLYSAIYNGTYLVFELLISIVVIASVYKPLKRYIQ